MSSRRLAKRDKPIRVILAADSNRSHSTPWHVCALACPQKVTLQCQGSSTSTNSGTEVKSWCEAAAIPGVTAFACNAPSESSVSYAVRKPWQFCGKGIVPPRSMVLFDGQHRGLAERLLTSISPTAVVPRGPRLHDGCIPFVGQYVSDAFDRVY